MRPLFHPQADDIRLEAILHALSDPARAAIFTRIAAENCPQTCTALADDPQAHSNSRSLKRSRTSHVLEEDRRSKKCHV